MNNMKLDELIERAQETTGAEGDALKAELARRFREGDGVARDEGEAAYWESCMEATEKPEAERAMTTSAKVEPAAKPISGDPDAYYRSLSEQELYQAYKTQDPWAVYYFASHMMALGDAVATQDLTELSDDLDRRFSAGDTSVELRLLLNRVKRACGTAYENGVGTPTDKRRACAYYEQAMELGSREAIVDALRCYESLGMLRSEPDIILPLLRKLEEGGPAGKMAAAKYYMEIDRTVVAAIHLNSVANDRSADPMLRADAMIELEHAGRRTTDEIAGAARQGDAAAAYAAAYLYATQNDFTSAEQMRVLCAELDPVVADKITKKLSEFWQKWEQRRQAQAEQERARRMEEEKLARAQYGYQKTYGGNESNQAGPKTARRPGWIRQYWLPIAAVLCGVLVISFFGAKNSNRQSKQVDPGKTEKVDSRLETIDVFKDIQFHYTGIAPLASAEMMNNSDNSFVQTVQFTAQPLSGLKNGDTITVTASYDKAAAKKAGYQVMETERKFTISGLTSYVTDVSQIDADCLAAMEQQAKDMVEAKLANSSAEDLAKAATGRYVYQATMNYGDLVLDTSYFLLIKPGFSLPEGYSYNRYIITYRTHFSFYYHEQAFGAWETYDGDVFYSVCFNHVMLDADGKTTVSLSDGLLCDLETSVDSVYSMRVSRFKDNYNVTEIEPPVEAIATIEDE